MYNLLTSSNVVEVAGLYSVLFLSSRTRNFPIQNSKNDNMPRTSVHTSRIVPATSNEGVLGSNFQLQEAHGSSMRETEDFEKKRKTIKDFCNRLKKMIYTTVLELSS